MAASIEQKCTALRKYVLDDAVKNQIVASLVGNVKPDFFMRSFLTALTDTPKLADCDQRDVALAICKIASTGLTIGGPHGHAWILPFYDGKARRMMPTPIIGYKGWNYLFHECEAVSSAQAFLVYGGEPFDVECGLNPGIKHTWRPDVDRRDANIKHAYAVAHLPRENAKPVYAVLTREEVDGYMARSPAVRGKKGDDGKLVAPGFSAWSTDYGAMAMKTAFLRLSRWVPVGPNSPLAQAADIDTASMIDVAVVSREVEPDAPEAQSGDVGFKARAKLAGQTNGNTVADDVIDASNAPEGE